MTLDSQIVFFINMLARVSHVRPPKVARGFQQPAERSCGMYSPDSRTIVITDTRQQEDLHETLLHEFQHYLDDLYGTELRGSLKGRHDSSFYGRLDRLRERVVGAAGSAGETRPQQPETARPQ